MVRSEIIAKLSLKVRPKLKNSEIKKILEIILETIVTGISQNKSTEWRFFGRFSPKKIKEKHNARNPRTGEIIYSSEKTSIAFKMAKELKSKINKNEGKIN
tara:strand:- start:120 stop:422 length:303 start_codon:yes stop_codon:yes gene_type:complete